MLDRLSKQLEKMLILLGKFVMYLTHVFVELWTVLRGLKGRKPAKNFIWKMIVFHQFSNQTTKELKEQQQNYLKSINATSAAIAYRLYI